MSSKIPSHKRPDICKPHSCKLQKCLFDTNYQMPRCEHHLNNMIECCRQWREQAFSCEGFMWMFKEHFTDDNRHQPLPKYQKKWYQED